MYVHNSLKYIADSHSLPVTMETTEEVELQVRPHPQDSSLTHCQIRNLSTVPAATVAHIAKYITDFAATKKGICSVCVCVCVCVCVRACVCVRERERSNEMCFQ